MKLRYRHRFPLFRRCRNQRVAKKINCIIDANFAPFRDVSRRGFFRPLINFFFSFFFPLPLRSTAHEERKSSVCGILFERKGSTWSASSRLNASLFTEALTKRLHYVVLIFSLSCNWRLTNVIYIHIYINWWFFKNENWRRWNRENDTIFALNLFCVIFLCLKIFDGKLYYYNIQLRSYILRLIFP